jgi:hypothetical protein
MGRDEILIAKPRYFRSSSPIREGLIEWNVAQPGIWSGQIGLDFAGLIESTDEGYLVTDWHGAAVGVFDTLAEAQLALEPAHRAELRELAERSALRTSLISTGLALIVVVAGASLAGAWLTSAI